jgi:HlyD family secretion protein
MGSLLEMNSRKQTLASVSPSYNRPARMKNLTKSWVILPGILVISVLITVWQSKHQDAIPVTGERATIRNLVHVVSGTGKARPQREVRISSEAAGEIVELPVILGQKIKAGDLLVKIKPDNYTASVKQAEAALMAARSESVMRRAQMLNDESDCRRLDELFSKKLISEADHTAAQARAQISQAAYQAALAQIEVAESNLDQNKDLLAKCTIVSPMDGTIDSLTTEIGERVVATGSFAGTEMMRIADLQSMQIWVDINENDIVNVKLGNRVKIHLDAYPDHSFAGVVERIASIASVQNQGTQQEVTNFEVRVQILHPELPVLPGMSANVDIETQTARQVISVPIQAVTVRSLENSGAMDRISDHQPRNLGTIQITAPENDRSGPQHVLFVVTGGLVKMVPVEIGIADNNYIQVLSGLKAGDEVVSGPYTAIGRDLEDGSAVKIDHL